MPVKTEEAVNGEESVVTSHANGGGKPVPGVETSAGSGHRKSKVGCTITTAAESAACSLNLLHTY